MKTTALNAVCMCLRIVVECLGTAIAGPQTWNLILRLFRAHPARKECVLCHTLSQSRHKGVVLVQNVRLALYGNMRVIAILRRRINFRVNIVTKVTDCRAPPW